MILKVFISLLLDTKNFLALNLNSKGFEFLAGSEIEL